jgi:O-acetylserine/cysteine efflux transporter
MGVYHAVLRPFMHEGWNALQAIANFSTVQSPHSNRANYSFFNTSCTVKNSTPSQPGCAIPMKIKDLCLAVAVAAIWGLNFSFIKLGVAHVDPFVLAGLRFTLTALPLILWLPRPHVAWRWLVLYGLAFGVGTWGLVTLSVRAGLAPGLAAWLLQSSAFITPLIGMLWLGDAWTRGQRLGAGIALAGFVVVVAATGGSTSLTGIALVLCAALALSVANIVVKRSGIQASEVLAFLAWSCLFAPLPLFGLAYASGGSAVFSALPQQLGGVALASLAFQVYPTTLFGYWVWNTLMARYNSAEVAPVALLVPIFALLFAWLIFGASTNLGQTLGIGFILLGLLVSTFYGRWHTWLQLRRLQTP